MPTNSIFAKLMTLYKPKFIISVAWLKFFALNKNAIMFFLRSIASLSMTFVFSAIDKAVGIYMLVEGVEGVLKFSSDTHVPVSPGVSLFIMPWRQSEVVILFLSRL